MHQPSQPQINPAQQNALARALVTTQSIERLQSIYSATTDASSQNVVNISPRNVGLIKGFFVDVEFNLDNTDGGELTLTPPGASNVLSQIRFDDLQNNTRIQTAGWHVHYINSVRNSRPFGLTNSLDASPIQYGSNWAVISAPVTIAAATPSTPIKMRYYVPLAYSNSDLRGALYANVVNATMQLQLTINPAIVGATTAAMTSVYTSATPSANSGSVTNVKITVYQHYLDQLPMGPQGPVLPMQDLSTIYELKNTAMTGVSVGQDYTVQYSNFRTFLSTFAVYENYGAGANGDDVNYWALRSANFTDIFKLSPSESALLTRLQLGTDFPNKTYYFNHRDRPLNSIQYGNIELVLNAADVTGTPRILMGYEDFAMINVVSGAGSLPAGG